MVNYSNTKIYKIWSTQGPHIYIGSTTKEYLSQRMDNHRSQYKCKTAKTTSKLIFEEYGVENCFIELLEAKDCKDKHESSQLEGHYIRTLDCVNKYIPGRTPKEYRETNKETISKNSKQFYVDNKETILQHHKQYKYTHKESIKLYLSSNKDKIKQQQQIYNEVNYEKIRQLQKNYREVNASKIKEYYETNKNKIKERRLFLKNLKQSEQAKTE